MKQRLVGASIWVLLAVVFLPSILDGSGVEGQADEIALGLPSQHATTLILQPDAESAEVVAVEKPLEVRPDTPAPARPAPEAPPVEPAPAPQEQSTSDPDPVPGKTDVDKGWIVQIGSFSSRDNAEGLSDQLGEAGYHSFVEASGIGSSRVYRVRIGPSETRDQAESVRKRLQSDEKRDGLVMEYP
ncbi:MAG: SPOR domain-containing protein [Pseudomonadota bacterium]